MKLNKKQLENIIEILEKVVKQIKIKENKVIAITVEKEEVKNKFNISKTRLEQRVSAKYFGNIVPALIIHDEQLGLKDNFYLGYIDLVNAALLDLGEMCLFFNIELSEDEFELIKDLEAHIVDKENILLNNSKETVQPDGEILLE